MDTKDLPQKVMDAIKDVYHPAINFPLIDLGIVKDIKVIDNTVNVTFAFPFPNIPIADKLVNSVANPLSNLGYEFNHSIVMMDEDEKDKFMELEQQGWKGL